MCMCGKPTINGEYGYCWNDRAHVGIHPINAPAIQDDDTLIYDEPGRCGGLDSHSHHVRVVKARYGGHALLVRHGAGDERIVLGYTSYLAINALAALDSNARYWVLLKILSIHRDATGKAAETYNHKWRQAAAEKRIKTRKVRNGVKVWIVPAETVAA